jgi:hypothetical protein
MGLKQVVPELLQGLEKIEKEQANDAARLGDALEASGNSVAALLSQSIRSGGESRFQAARSGVPGLSDLS